MMVVATIAAWSFLAFGFILFVVQLAAHEVGFWIGRRQAAQRETRIFEGVGIISGGVLGLLAFVLALTLSFASERFNDRAWWHTCGGECNWHRVVKSKGHRASTRR